MPGQRMLATAAMAARTNEVMVTATGDIVPETR